MKSFSLAEYIAQNLDIGSTLKKLIASSGPSGTAVHPTSAEEDEEGSFGQVEEAALWYRAVYDLTFQLLAEQGGAFLDFLVDDLALFLGVMGCPPGVVVDTIVERSTEYASYRKWVYSESESAKGTLLREAAKHVGDAIGIKKDPLFQVLFANLFLEKLKAASASELLAGK